MRRSSGVAASKSGRPEHSLVIERPGDTIRRGDMALSVPQTMTAAVISSPRHLEFRDAPVPKPQRNQLLVRIEGCGVCASNVPPWEGRPWFRYPLEPGQLGHEAWGRIAQLGDGVAGFDIGDRVAFISNHGYAQYDIADAGATVALPAQLDDQPFPGEPLGCAINIFQRSGIDIDDTVAVIGVGFLGALLIQMASNIGARAIAIARSPFALDLARKMGASEIVALNDHSQIIEQVKQFTGGELCDVVIEATGKQRALDIAAELTRERGRLIIAGYHQDGTREVNMQLWNWRGLDVINAHERDPFIYLDGMCHAVSAVETGFLNPMPLYTHHLPLTDLGIALELAAERPQGFIKALVYPE